MNEELAKQIVKEAIDLAIKKGCYNLIEVVNIVSALNFINMSTLSPLNNENNGQSTDNK